MPNIYHIPTKDKWEFDESVTDIFEDMLARSIPQYDEMRSSVTNLAIEFIKPACHVVDIGCSKGDQINHLILKYGNYCHYHGLECSDSMIESAKNRFKDFQNIQIHKMDLRTDWLTISNISVCLSVLTLQFVPIEYRLSLLKKIYLSLETGGALILVEKVIGASAELDKLTTKLYYDLKQSNGYSNYEIERKRLSLEGVLVPVTAKWNEEMLKMVGFTQIDCFWRWMNFTGLIAIK
jgi:tRNA (cmo5U34)-methyltransferase